MVRPETLQNPERDLGLEDRASVADLEPEEETEAAEPRVPKGPSLAERIAAARRLTAPPEYGCRDCWTRGRDAALDVIGNPVDEDALEARLGSARAIVPKPSELHWLAYWQRGRDAALEAIEGR